MEIIGLSGYARSGKDAAAKVLVEEFGFRRVAFADKLREVLYALNPLIMERYDEIHDPFYLDAVKIYNKKLYLRDVIDLVGWDGYKETPYGEEIRRLLQRLGTEAGRQTLWDSIWVDAAFADVKPWEKIVVTDMRFPNEMKAVLSRNGYTVRINRNGVGPANNHPSETSLDDAEFSAVILNDGTLVEFQEKIRRFANEANL